MPTGKRHSNNGLGKSQSIIHKPRNINDAETSERKFDEDQGVYMDTESPNSAF